MTLSFKINSQQRAMLLSIIALFALSLMLYHQPASGNYIFAGPDYLTPQALGEGTKLIEQETGEFPLWQPGIFSGMPTLHAFNGISRLYLPEFIARAMTSIGIPIFWFFLMHLVFGGLGVIVLLRSRKISWAGSLLGGTGFMLMPYFNTMLVHSHGSQMMTLAYLPWVIWALMRLYERTDLLSGGILALLVGIQFQRGHVQISYFIMMMTGLLLLVAAVIAFRDTDREPKKNWLFVGLSLAAIFLGVVMAFSLILPVLNYTPFSVRGGAVAGGAGLDYATAWSFSFGETMTFLLPSFYGFGGVTYWGNMPFTDYPNYMGIILFALAGCAVAKERNWFVITLAIGGFLAYLLSVGKGFFLYELFYNYLPYFKKFRVPSMLLVLTQFSVTVLAAIGFDGLIKWLADSKKEEAAKFIRITAGVAGGLFIIFMALPSMIGGGIPAPRGVPANAVQMVQNLRLELIQSDALWFLLIAGTVVGGLYAWHRGLIRQQSLVWGIVAISIIDLMRVDYQLVSPSEKSLRRSPMQPKAFVTRFLKSDPVIEFLQQEPEPFRIFPLAALQNENRFAAFGLESIGGYHPAKLANYEKFRAATQLQSAGIFQMLNVKYLISPQRFQDDRFEEVFSGQLNSTAGLDPVAVYKFKDYLGRAWFPKQVVFNPSAENIYAELANANYDPTDIVYVTDQTDDVVAGATGRVIESAWEGGHIRLKVEAEAGAMMVLSEVYYPEGWIARLDNKIVPIHEINTVLRGIVTAGGVQDITLDFEPDDLRMGLIYSRLATLMVFAMMIPAAVGYIRRRKQGSAELAD